MRANRLKICAASGLVLAALGAGSYGVVTLSSGTTAAAHWLPLGDPCSPPCCGATDLCHSASSPSFCRSVQSDSPASSRRVDTSRRVSSSSSSSSSRRATAAASDIGHSPRRRR